MEKVKLPAHIIESLKQVASENGFENPDYEFLEGSDKGFVGLIKRCRITENNRCLSVICKLLPNDDEHNQKYDSFELFEREVFVYEKILPELEKIQVEHGLSYHDSKGFWSFPKCYRSDYNKEHGEMSFVLMEDLIEEKFIVRDMFKPADLNHARQVFIVLAKLHAISFALKVKKPEIFSQYKNMSDLMCRLMTTPTMAGLASRNVKLASELFSLPEEEDIKKKILFYENNLWAQIEQLLARENAEPFGAVCHGDCWINNVMFNYKDENSTEIKDVRLIDWQMTRYGSAASELMYFLFCYTDKPLRDQHQAELLETYYTTLENLLKVFDLSVNEVYPRSQFEWDLKKFGKFAFAMTSFSMPIVCKYPAKLFEKRQSVLTEEEEAARNLYVKTMKDIVCDLIAMEAF